MIFLNAIDHYNAEENFKLNVKCPWETCVSGKRMKVEFQTPETCKGNWGNKICPNYIKK